jgi:hypothetical protein
VLSEHGIKIAPSIYAQAKTPMTLAELAEAYLVIALVDLHSADWASWGGKRVARRPLRRP